MAITQVTTVTVDGLTIGLSDTIYNLIQAGEFTIANLQPYMIVGQKTVGEQYYASLSAAERNYSGSGGDTPAWFPVNNTGRLGPPTVEFQTKASVTLPHVAYGRNFLVHGTLNAGGEPQQIRADNMSASDLRVVTSIDYKKIYYDVEMASVVYNFDSPSGSATYYQTGSQGCVRTIDNDEDAQCFVYSIFGDDADWYCIKDWMFPADDSANNGWHMSNSQSISGSYADTNSSLGTGYTNYTTTKTMFRWINNQSGAIYGGGNWNWNNSGHLVTVNGNIVQACDYSGSGVYAGGCYNIISGLDNALKQLANAGLKFKWNNTWYKPIAEGGIVTGYTDDMTEESEWDDITDVTGNTVPDTPGGGGGGGESFDSDQSAYNDAYTTGVPSSQLYAMTLAQVNDMFDKLTNGGIIPANFEPGNAVISIQRYPFSLSSFASSVAGNITWTARPDVIGPETPTRIMFPPTGEEITGYPIYNPVKRVSLGSFTLSEFWTNYIAFLNREISASLYIPFCGIIEIDINAILNKTITVYLTIDVISGGCTAAVDINGCMYTTVSGSCSADMYFSTSNYGTIRAALRSNTAEQVYNAAQIAAGAIGAAASGNWAGWGTQAATGAIFNTVGKAIKRTMMRNGVTPSVRGTAGDMSSWKLPMHCQLILSLPRPNHSSDSIYGHSHGYLTVSEKTVGSCSGLTVCDNPDVSNIDTATDTEKEMIYNMLQNGVYV